MIDWLKKHRLLVAWLSVIGSVAGLGFASADLHSVLKERKAQKKLKTKLTPPRNSV